MTKEEFFLAWMLAQGRPKFHKGLGHQPQSYAVGGKKTPPRPPDLSGYSPLGEVFEFGFAAVQGGVIPILLPSEMFEQVARDLYKEYAQWFEKQMQKARS